MPALLAECESEVLHAHRRLYFVWEKGMLRILFGHCLGCTLPVVATVVSAAQVVLVTLSYVT